MIFKNLRLLTITTKSLASNKFSWLLSGLIWLMLVLPAQAVDLRVAIKKQVPSLKVGSSTAATVKDDTGKQLGQLTPMSSLAASYKNNKIAISDRVRGQELIIEPEDNGYVWIGDRWYRGTTRLILQNKGITAINNVDLEQYLYSVVGAGSSFFLAD